MINSIKPIYIKPDNYFYKYYNNYIKQQNNCESDQFILNLLKCKQKIIIPPYYLKETIIKNVHNYNNNTTNNYYLNIKNNIKNNTNCCSICYEKLNDNYIMTPCLHTYCYKCCNHIHNNNCNSDCNSNNFKCSMCSSQYNINDLLFINDNNKTIAQILIDLYEPKKNILNKEFIYKYIGYKTYFIMKSILKNKTPFTLKNISKKYVVIIESNNEWINLMSNLYSTILFFKTVNEFYNYLNLNSSNKNKNYIVYFTNYNTIINNKINCISQYKIDFYQFIIQNTIDEKIFKGKVIIKK